MYGIVSIYNSKELIAWHKHKGPVDWFYDFNQKHSELKLRKIIFKKKEFSKYILDEKKLTYYCHSYVPEEFIDALVAIDCGDYESLQYTKQQLMNLLGTKRLTKKESGLLKDTILLLDRMVNKESMVFTLSELQDIKMQYDSYQSYRILDNEPY